MNVEGLMTRNLQTCTPDHGLDCAARIMWESDCGVVCRWTPPRMIPSSA